MTIPVLLRRSGAKHLLCAGFVVVITLLSASAVAGGGGHGGGHGGGGHGSFGGGHGGGGHSSFGGAGHGFSPDGGHVGHSDSGHSGGSGHGGFDHGGHHDAVHHNFHDFHPFSYGFFGLGYSYAYAPSYYRDFCNPYSTYYDPAYCTRYYPSNAYPAASQVVSPYANLSQYYPSDAYPAAYVPASSGPVPEEAIPDGVVVRVPVLSSPNAPDALP